MTSPIGKILLAKLPKDIVQFCIEPMLMISEEEVRKNHDVVVRYLWTKSIYKADRVGLTPTGIPTWTPLQDDIDGCRLWLQLMFAIQRHERKMRKKKQCCTIL